MGHVVRRFLVSIGLVYVRDGRAHVILKVVELLSHPVCDFSLVDCLFLLHQHLDRSLLILHLCVDVLLLHFVGPRVDFLKHVVHGELTTSDRHAYLVRIGALLRRVWWPRPEQLLLSLLPLTDLLKLEKVFIVSHPVIPLV